MNSKCSVGAVCFLSLVLLYGPAFGHGTEKHGQAKHTDAQMEKMHHMMPMFSVAAARLETALANENLTATEAEANKILSALPDLEKSRPHKNLKNRPKFVALVKEEKIAVATTLDFAKKGNFVEARATFQKAEALCTECHTKFRD